MANQTITISKTEYQIVNRETPQDRANAGLNNLAQYEMKNGVVETLTLKRPNGSHLYQVAVFKSGSMSKVVHAC